MWRLHSILYYYGYWLSILYHKSVCYLVPVSKRVSFFIFAAFRLVRRVVVAADTFQPLIATHSMLLSVAISELAPAYTCSSYSGSKDNEPCKQTTQATTTTGTENLEQNEYTSKFCA